MALHKPVRTNYGGKSPVSIKYQNLLSFKEGMILLCQSILKTRRISHLRGSALFTIPLITLIFGSKHFLHAMAINLGIRHTALYQLYLMNPGRGRGLYQGAWDLKHSKVHGIIKNLVV